MTAPRIHGLTAKEMRDLVVASTDTLNTPKQAPIGVEFKCASATWRPDLMCYVQAIAYCFQRRMGGLFLAKYNCCDMTCAIALFESIDPHVRQIDTWSGGVPDTVYVRDDAGEWTAWAAPSP